MSKRFSWGSVIEHFDFNFDGSKLEVVKYHPWVTEGCNVRAGVPDEEVVQYHCEAIRESFHSMDALLVSWIAHKNLGLNQGALVSGICRALSVQG